MSADERSVLMEKCLEQEEKNQAAMSSELAGLRELVFKKSQMSYNLAEKLKTLDNEIQVYNYEYEYLWRYIFKHSSWCSNAEKYTNNQHTCTQACAHTQIKHALHTCTHECVGLA